MKKVSMMAAVVSAIVLSGCQHSTDEVSQPSANEVAKSARVVSHAGTYYNGYTNITTRVAFDWPFRQQSIWNMPIGLNADYVEATQLDVVQGRTGVRQDPDYIVWASTTDQLMDNYFPSNANNGNNRWYYSNITAKTGSNFSGKTSNGQIRVPSWFTVEDIVGTSGQAGYSAPNACAAIIQASDLRIKDFQPFCRPYAERGQNKFIGYSLPYFTQQGQHIVNDDGIQGAHFGSGLSSMGGCIRSADVTGNTPIRHAIKILLSCKRNIYYDANDNSYNPGAGDYFKNGFRWPADRNDSYANGTNTSIKYGGTNSTCRQGSLLAVMPAETEGSLGLQTAMGKKIFHAAQDFGFYMCDDTATDDVIISFEKNALTSFEQAYPAGSTALNNWKADIIKIVRKLKVINNNYPNNVGGGAKGTEGNFGNGRRAPLAPTTFN